MRGSVRSIKDLRVFCSHQSAIVVVSAEQKAYLGTVHLHRDDEQLPLGVMRILSTRAEDAELGRSAQQLGARVHPAVLNHIGQEARRMFDSL